MCTSSIVSADDYEALVENVRRGLSDVASDVEVGVDPSGRLTVAATLKGTDPVATAAVLVDVVDRSLVATDLFEQFDVSGKVLNVQPVAPMVPAQHGA